MDIHQDRLKHLQADADVIEIHVVGSSCIRLIHQIPPDQIIDPLFRHRQEAIDWIQEFAWSARARLDVAAPEAGGVTGEGWRWHAVIPPMSGDQPLLVMRRALFDQIGVQHFYDRAQLMPLILAHVSANKPLIIAGSTGAGKTAFLVAILKSTAMAQRLFFLETIREIPALSPSWSFLLIKPESPVQTLNAALRLSPGRFVIGEMREGETPLFFAACCTGHGGAIATMHGSSTAQIEMRLLSMGQSVDPSLELGVVILERDPLPAIRAFAKI